MQRRRQEEYRKRYDVIGRSAKLKQRSGLITGEGMRRVIITGALEQEGHTVNVFRFPWMGVYRGKVLGVHFLPFEIPSPLPFLSRASSP